MTTICAVPYDTSAPAFYFNSLDEYQQKYDRQLPVEEYEMQFIDGDNPQLFNAANICQGNINTWFDELEDIEDDTDQGIAIRFLLSLGYSLSDALERADEVQLYHGKASNYAYDLYSDTDIPSHLANYIDYDRIARDLELSGDIAEFAFETFITNAQEF